MQIVIADSRWGVRANNPGRHPMLTDGLESNRAEVDCRNVPVQSADSSDHRSVIVDFAGRFAVAGAVEGERVLPKT